MSISDILQNRVGQFEEEEDESSTEEDNMEGSEMDGEELGAEDVQILEVEEERNLGEEAEADGSILLGYSDGTFELRAGHSRNGVRTSSSRAAINDNVVS